MSLSSCFVKAQEIAGKVLTNRVKIIMIAIPHPLWGGVKGDGL